VQEAAEAIDQFQLLEDGAEPSAQETPLHLGGDPERAPGISEKFIVERLGLDGLLASVHAVADAYGTWGEKSM
jgi:hypothetical protein